jgi:hypothetical protein
VIRVPSPQSVGEVSCSDSHQPIIIVLVVVVTLVLYFMTIVCDLTVMMLMMVVVVATTARWRLGVVAVRMVPAVVLVAVAVR